ncbi:MAG: winged helix-turn-helix domain-containing protein, partial [Saprospiraceae bacterium]|nr:winged helix-turn-helix domain-containing protein [Saprospiraceae bacterium]
MAGTTRETATRSLYKLQELGMIRLSGKSIIISDEKKLSAMTS